MRLSEYYGAAWTYGAEPSATWIYHLQDLGEAQLSNGICNLPHHPSDFPPNPGQFKDLCLTNFNWERQCHKTLDLGSLIEDKTSREKRIERNKAELAKLREEVGL